MGNIAKYFPSLFASNTKRMYVCASLLKKFLRKEMKYTAFNNHTMLPNKKKYYNKEHI